MRTVNNIAISSKFIIRHIINPPKYGPNQLWRINEYSLYCSNSIFSQRLLLPSIPHTSTLSQTVKLDQILQLDILSSIAHLVVAGGGGGGEGEVLQGKQCQMVHICDATLASQLHFTVLIIDTLYPNVLIY